MKIFEFNPAKGYIDQVSGAVGVNTNGEIERTEKGLAWLGDIGINASSIDTGVSISPTIYSVAGSFKFKSGNFSTIISFIDAADDGVFISVDASGRMDCRMNTSDLYTSVDKEFDNNEWHHYIVLYDGTIHSLYVDGVLRDTNVVSESISITSNIFIGQIAYTAALYAKGHIGKQTIYDHALTSEERAKLYKEFLQASPITKTIR